MKRYGTPQRGAPFAGIMSVLVGTGFFFVGLGVTESPWPQAVGAAAILFGLVLLSMRRGTMIDPVARRVTRRLGWWFKPRNEEYEFGAFTNIAIARTQGTTPIYAVQLEGRTNVFLPAGGRGFKKDAIRRAKEIAELMGLELSKEPNRARPLELF